MAFLLQETGDHLLQENNDDLLLDEEAAGLSGRYIVKPRLGTPLNPWHPLAQGLVGAYLINEGGGNTLYSSAFDSSGTMTGQTREVNLLGLGIAGVDGGDYAVSTAKTPYYATTTAVVRFMRTSTPNVGIYAAPLVSHHSNEGVASDWFFYIKPSDLKLRIDIPWVLDDALTGTATIEANIEYTLAFTRTGSAGAWTYTAYINGAQDAQAATASNPAGNAELNTLLGLSADQTVGSHDPCGILLLYLRYNRALSAGELRQIHLTPYAMWEPSAMRRWARRAA